MRRPRIVTLASAAILFLPGWVSTAMPHGRAALSTHSGVPAVQEAQASALGSAVPCAVPLRWRIAEVDPRFGLRPPEARAAVREASRLWEEALGQALFTEDAATGFPISFEFDDRQAMVQLRNRFEQELDVTDARLGIRVAEIQALNARFDTARTDYEERVSQLQERTREHNERVRSWNERGGAPAQVRTELQRTQQLIALERESLQTAERELREVLDWLQAETDRVNRGIRDRAREADAFERDFPTTVSESGRYLESVRSRNGTVVSLSREIRVYRFDGRDELVTVIAHELGHALGLGHATTAGSIMSDVLQEPVAELGGPRLQPTDLSMLRSRCPDL